MQKLFLVHPSFCSILQLSSIQFKAELTRCSLIWTYWLCRHSLRGKPELSKMLCLRWNITFEFDGKSATYLASHDQEERYCFHHYESAKWVWFQTWDVLISELTVVIADSTAFRRLLTIPEVVASLPALCWIGVRPCVLRIPNSHRSDCAGYHFRLDVRAPGCSLVQGREDDQDSAPNFCGQCAKLSILLGISHSMLATRK